MFRNSLEVALFSIGFCISLEVALFSIGFCISLEVILFLIFCTSFEMILLNTIELSISSFGNPKKCFFNSSMSSSILATL